MHRPPCPAGDVVLLHSDAATVERDYLTLRQLQPTLFDLEPEEEAEAGAALAPEAKLRAEAEECIRLARRLAALAAEADAEAEAEAEAGAETETGAEAEAGAAPRWGSVAARFPLVGGYELPASAGSAAVRLSAASPRRLGDLLLRALRNARTEEEAAAGLWALLGAVEPSSCGAES